MSAGLTTMRRFTQDQATRENERGEQLTPPDTKTRDNQPSSNSPPPARPGRAPKREALGDGRQGQIRHNSLRSTDASLGTYFVLPLPPITQSLAGAIKVAVATLCVRSPPINGPKKAKQITCNPHRGSSALFAVAVIMAVRHLDRE